MIAVAAVQMDLKQCGSEEEFVHLIDSLTYQAASQGAQVVVFPEDVGFCLAWAKESKAVASIRAGQSPEMVLALGWRSWLERAVDGLLSRIRLRAMGEWLAQGRIERIVRRAFGKAALTHRVIVVSGSTYVRRIDGLYNSLFVFDAEGMLKGECRKAKLVPLEISWGVKAEKSAKPIKAGDLCIGACICFDLNEPSISKELVAKGADFIVAPSAGWRPWPGYPFDPQKERPQIERAMENNRAVVRPYCCGWLSPGLYFEGRSQIIGPDGEVLAEARRLDQQEILCVDIPVPLWPVCDS